MNARLGRVLAASWLVLLGAHVWMGGSVVSALLAGREPLPSGPNATSDLWLQRAKVRATTAEVQALLAHVPGREDVILVAPRTGRAEFPTWPFLSYAAWPRRMWVYHCDEGVTQPFIGDPDAPRVPWLLYLEIKPPRAFRRLGAAGRLRLVAADPSVPWTSFCSS